MNFSQLQYVISIHEHQNFGKAAHACDVTQATLSAMIKKLEEEVGYKIFDRSSQPVVTTEEGLDLIRHAHGILQLQREIINSDKQELSELTGELRLGVIPTVANSLLSVVLPDLMSQNPKLQLEIKEITTDQIKDQLKKNEIDLAIAATPFDDNSFQEEILYYEPMLVYGDDTTKKQYVSTKDIMDNKIWLLEEGHCFRNQVVTLCEMKERQRGIEQLNFQANSFETLMDLVEMLGGFTLLPELYLRRLPQQKKDRMKSFQKPIPVREISIVSYRLNAMNKTITYLQKMIQSQINPLLTSSNYRNSDLDIIGI